MITREQIQQLKTPAFREQSSVTTTPAKDISATEKEIEKHQLDRLMKCQVYLQANKPKMSNQVYRNKFLQIEQMLEDLGFHDMIDEEVDKFYKR